MVSLLLPATALLAGSVGARPNGVGDYIVAAGDTPAGTAASAASGSSSGAAALTSSDVEPCLVVSMIVNSAARRGAEIARMEPDVALRCLRSVPLDVQGNKKQLLGIKTMADFQSTLDLLIDPPDGYVYPGVDILGGLEKLSDGLEDGTYDNEYDFQLDLARLIIQARDQHFNYGPDITRVLTFGRETELYSLSKDGSELPEVYSGLDLDVLAYSDLTNYTASPIVKINSQPVEDYLRGYADVNGQAQDHDSNYNAVFVNVPWPDNGGTFSGSLFYMGNETVYEFKNGSTRREQNIAGTASDFTGVRDGRTFFEKFCTGYAPLPLSVTNITNSSTYSVSASAYASAAPTPVTTAVPFSAVPQQTSYPAPNAYPVPWVTTPDYSLGCYFPSDQPDTMVLSIPSFGPKPDGRLSELTFANTARACLATAHSKQKKKLIIDLRGNGGGIALLAFDLFKQLFPAQTPYGATNFRAFPLFNDVGQIITEEYEDVNSFTRTRQDYVNGYNSIFNANEGLNAHLDDYDSWAAFYGPVQAHGADFTHLLRYNLSDSYDRMGTPVSGYGNETGITPVQVFAADDMVILQDGLCASTCAVFAEFMKSQGHVQQIVFGGRAQTGPMQAVGGVKGANVYPLVYLRNIVNEAYKVASPARQAELEDKYAVEIETFPYAMRRVARSAETGELSARVNVRNNIRQGDAGLTPLQFVYEAADCRLWYTAAMMVDQTRVWRAGYEAKWGEDGFDVCVEGSTGDESAGWGVGYFPGGGDGAEGASGTRAGKGPPKNGAERVGGRLVVAVAAVMGLMALW